jgi:hypothetical protein
MSKGGRRGGFRAGGGIGAEVGASHSEVETDAGVSMSAPHDGSRGERSRDADLLRGAPGRRGHARACLLTLSNIPALRHGNSYFRA